MNARYYDSTIQTNLATPISTYLATLVYTHLPFCFDRVAVKRVIELFKQSETDQS